MFAHNVKFSGSQGCEIPHNCYCVSQDALFISITSVVHKCFLYIFLLLLLLVIPNIQLFEFLQKNKPVMKIKEPYTILFYCKQTSLKSNTLQHWSME